jgi:hypothetical protein
MVNIAAGDYLPGAHLTTEVKSASDSTTAIGDVCTIQSNVWKTAGTTTNNKGPFRVAVSGSNYTATGASTIQTADTSFSALVDGFVYLKADGVVPIGSLVMCSASNAGRIQAYTSSVIATTPLQADVQASRDEFRLVVGVYEGHANEGSVGTIPTAGADGDILRIRFRGNV